MGVAPTKKVRTPSPGEYVEEWLDFESMTQTTLATKLGVSRKHLNDVIHGRSHISTDFAIKLDRVTGISTEFWLTMDAKYAASQAKSEFSHADIKSAQSIFTPGSLSFLRSNGDVKFNWRSPSEHINELLKFLNLGSLPSLLARCGEVRPAVAFRQSLAHEIYPASVLIWLRLGELEAEKHDDLPKFDAVGLQNSLSKFHSIMCGPVEEFIPETQKILHAHGVRFVITPSVDGARAFGASRIWRGSPLIQVSPRYKREDTYWFTVLHEIAHVLHDDINENRVSFNDDDHHPCEARANTWAEEFLLSKEVEGRLHYVTSHEDIRALGMEFNLPPGVIAGRMAHLKIKNYSWLRKLIRPLNWY